MKKAILWIALLPVLFVVWTVAFSPRAAPPDAQIQQPAQAGAPAAQSGAPAQQPGALALKPTALPVMYEFFTGW